MADYNIAQAFEEIENELIDSMMRNFSRHRAEEEAEERMKTTDHQNREYIMAEAKLKRALTRINVKEM